MTRVVVIATVCALLGLTPATAAAAFGFEEVDVTFTAADGSPATQAGSHPFAMTVTVRLNTVENAGLEAPDGDLEQLLIDLPPGVVANPAAVPACSTADFMQIEGSGNDCPDSSAVGIGEVTASASGPIPAGSEDFLDPVPLYKLTPPEGAVGRIGFVAAGTPVVAELGLSEAPPHNGFVAVSELSQAVLFYGARMSVWGTPAHPVHDPDRGQCVFIGGNCPVAVPEMALLTVPRSCTGPVETVFHASSRQNPGQWVSAIARSHDNSEPPAPLGFTGCGKLPFQPQIDAQPTTYSAETPSGLDVSIDIANPGLANPDGFAQSEVKKLVLTLPEGMTINFDLGDGIFTCTPAQYAQETVDSEPGEGCPQDSEIGTIEVETPLLVGEVLEGQVIAAQPDDPGTVAPGAENPFDSPLALYVVIRDPDLGILLKQAGEVEVDPVTEQPIAAFDQIAQLPISHLGLHLHDGDRSPLITPPACGEFATKATFSPWSNPGTSYIALASFEITSGNEGGPCPSGEPPDDPDVDNPSPAPSPQNPPPANPATPGAAPLSPAKRRNCAKGKRRAGRAKARCSKRRCSRRARKAPKRRCAGPRRRNNSDRVVQLNDA